MPKTYQASGNFVPRTIAGDLLLIPVGEQTRKLNGFATFTESGQFLWELLSSGTYTEDALAAHLCAEYGITKEEALPDVRNFLDKMVANGIIDVTE